MERKKRGNISEGEEGRAFGGGEGKLCYAMAMVVTATRKGKQTLAIPKERNSYCSQRQSTLDPVAGRHEWGVTATYVDKMTW